MQRILIVWVYLNVINSLFLFVCLFIPLSTFLSLSPSLFCHVNIGSSVPGLAQWLRARDLLLSSLLVQDWCSQRLERLFKSTLKNSPALCLRPLFLLLRILEDAISHSSFIIFCWGYLQIVSLYIKSPAWLHHINSVLFISWSDYY